MKKYTYVKIHNDGHANVYNFETLEAVEDAIESNADNVELKHSYVINNETGEVEAVEYE